MRKKGVVLLKDGVAYEICELVKKRERMSVREIAISVQANYNTIRSALIRLTNAGHLERVRRGEYKYKSKQVQ